MELDNQKMELLQKTIKQLDEREMLTAKYRRQSIENQKRRFVIANRFRQPFYEKFIESLKLEKKQIENQDRKDKESLRKFSQKQYKHLLEDLKEVGKTCDERTKALLEYRKRNYKDNKGNPVHIFCGLKADHIEQFRLDAYVNDYSLPQAEISQPDFGHNLVRFKWVITENEKEFWAGFRAFFFWNNPPSGLIGGTAEMHVNGAYYLDAIHHCFNAGSYAYLNGEAKLTIAQGSFPLYISEDSVFFSEMCRTPGWNEGSIGFAGPIPMKVPTIMLSIPRNVRCEAGSPLLGILQIRFLGYVSGDGKVLLDCKSEEFMKMNFAGLVLTIET